MSTFRLLVGDCRETLRSLPDASVQCVVTSPPYWGLRDYGHDGQLGLERTPEEYVAHMVEVFREVRRVLRPDGTLWLNLGDSYNAAGREGHGTRIGFKQQTNRASADGADACRPSAPDLKPKDLVGIPWRVALALQADGWYLRSDVIWCLSGGTKVYARTQKGEMPSTIKDLVRLDPATVQLWNGEKWTQVLGWSESRRGEPLEIELRSGERIGCTVGHIWPTQRGNVRADELQAGDVIQSTRLPEPEAPYSPAYIGHNVAWMLGLYLAEGSRDTKGRLQFAGHTEQNGTRLAALRPLAEAFGGTAREYSDGNRGCIVVDCPALAAVVEQYIHGNSAKTKGIKVRAWSHTDAWLDSLLCGYLDGDGHNDEGNARWRLGFTRNDRLADDLRTLSARLGYTLTLRATTGMGFGKRWPIYRGELRKDRSGHHSEQSRSEVVAVRRSRARRFWDIGVADEPHLFALASGVLTHNSKPNPMPESVTDRPTKAHEYVFLLSKSPTYFYDADAIAGKCVKGGGTARPRGKNPAGTGTRNDQGRHLSGGFPTGDTRNARTVWTIATQPYAGAHFATFPPELAERCIKAGSKPGDTVLDPFAGSGTTGAVAIGHGRNFIGCELNPEYVEMARRRIGPMFEERVA